MESGHAFTVDESRAYHPDHDLGGRYAPGLVDEIGDRILILDDRRTPTLELLRFRQTLTTFPGFEVALRRRVERLRHFLHPAFARTPAVEYLGQDRCLALLSNYTPGRRLSEVLAHAQDPALATSLIHQLTPALDALNDYSQGVGHGALTASRIVIAPEGQLIIVEHVLGSAVERLHLTAAAIRRDLGIPVPGTETGYPRTDGPTDCFQLALIALSMLLGRSLSSDEYSDLAGALNAALPAPDRESVEPVSRLRLWLEQALQLERGFLSSGEARAALLEVDVADPADIARRWRAVGETPEGALGDRLVLNDALWEGSPVELTPDLPPAEVPLEPLDAPPIEVAEAAQQPIDQPVAPPVAVPFLPETHVHARPAPGWRRSTFFKAPNGYLRWALVALALCAIVEAFVIARLLAGRGSIPPPAAVAQVNLVTTDPGAPVMVDGRLAGVTPLDLSINSEMRSISVASPQAPAPKQEMVVGSTGQDTNPLEIGRERVAADPRPSTVPAPPPQRAGGIRVSSPIELEVFEGDRRLGSTATGIVPAPAGRHEVDLVNSVLGFRSRQVVDVRAGQVVALTVSPPNGRININAVPWAEVLIDGKPVGETPIGNLSIPLGEHEIVFRHPQLGEVRRTAVVRSDSVTRVSANLER
jgi:PEGA domain